jgi:hypothetical protein
VYRFPKGGVYEGEWRGGRMDGVGVRTFASGRVQVGGWASSKPATLLASASVCECVVVVGERGGGRGREAGCCIACSQCVCGVEGASELGAPGEDVLIGKTS